MLTLQLLIIFDDAFGLLKQKRTVRQCSVLDQQQLVHRVFAMSQMYLKAMDVASGGQFLLCTSEGWSLGPLASTWKLGGLDSSLWEPENLRQDL